jgi:hypothetical protein
MIIGVTGRKRSGKDALGTEMCARTGALRMAFADATKRAVMDLWGLTYEQCFGDQKEVVDTRWGMTPREILQRFGTEVCRSVHSETWTRRLLDDMAKARRGWRWSLEADSIWRRRKGDPYRNFVVTDVRFANEAAVLRVQGGFIVRVVRPGLAENAFGDHASETEQGDIAVDFTVVNDGRLKDLGRKADEVLRWARTSQEAST